jgi:hypothetical protein
MITNYERSDLIHILKMHGFTLLDADTAQLSFSGQVKGKDYVVNLLVIEDLPSIVIKQNGELFYSETVKSVDDMKIFLDEQLYNYIEN